MAFADAFGIAYISKYYIEEIWRRRIPLTVMTDSLPHLDMLTKSSMTAERRLIVDRQPVKRDYKQFEANNIALFRLQHTVSNALTAV